ncbi:cupin domain-containing protein [Zhouia amylolytica]|uniref:cupin domain-containing protein n=1 Tax=Zhouia amylolytica TaxID=376730 RepID=UPI0020CED973|nr:cupin domain-containing protein [Zhouia amylolytica]MCQ0111641.1 cupin domain-containing protein [Zhouia amylolytica]
MNGKTLIEQLDLQPHPEGGYYKETYRSTETTLNRDGEKRNVCTAIHFLLEDFDKSHFHRIQSDELWFFHKGAPLEIYYISEGILHTVVLGDNLEKGDKLFYKIPANTWFASKVKDEKGFALVSCTVAPGFDFADFELATNAQLKKEFPDLKSVIDEFTLE